MVVMASGPLRDPAPPRIPGLETFGGRLFHSARWDHAHALAGRTVAVIGTGASAVQFVPFRHAAMRPLVAWMARRHLASQVHEPALRARLTPSYAIGCKRILLSDDFYPAVAQPNVETVTTAIQRVTPRGVLTIDARERPVDRIILGTGFRATDPPLAPHVRGRDGRTLADAWKGSPPAYMGTTATGFPNFFFLLGPNTGLGHSSVMLMVESPIRHVLGVLSLMQRRGALAAEPTRDAQRRYVSWVDRELQGTVWNSGRCHSWYLDATGRNSALWPFGVGRFRRTVSRVRGADYRLITARQAPSAEGAHA